MQPGWPYYGKQYGPATPKGTITAYVEDGEGPIAEAKVGVVPGSYVPKARASKVGREIPIPSEWKYTGADGYVYLGEYEYGTYIVVYQFGEGSWSMRPVTIDDSNRNPIAYFYPRL